MKWTWKELWGLLCFIVHFGKIQEMTSVSVAHLLRLVWSSREDVGPKLKSDLRVLIRSAFFDRNTYIVVFSDQSKLARIRPLVLKLVRSEQRGAEVRQQKVVDLIIPVCDELNPE